MLDHENGKKKNKFVVKDGVGLIRAQEVEKWKETQRISLWDTKIEELKEPPYFLYTKTFLASGECINSLWDTKIEEQFLICVSQEFWTCQTILNLQSYLWRLET